MTLYNDELITILSVPDIGDGVMGRFYATPSMWASWPNARDVDVSLRFIFHMTCIVHARRVAHTTGIFLYVNSMGKAWLLKMTLIALDCGNGQLEVVSARSVLPHASVLPADFQVAYGLVDERHLRQRLSQHFETRWSSSDGKKESEIKRKQAERATKKASQGFQCSQCKATETSQRRYNLLHHVVVYM